MLIGISAAFYFLGLVCFYHIADFTKPEWGVAYYLWDKAKDVLFSAVISYKIPKSKFKTIYYFCVIRLGWEIAALTINSNINDSKVIDFLFLLFIVIWVYQLIREWSKSK